MGAHPGTRSPTTGTRTSASTSGTGTTRSSARVTRSTAPISSTAAATRPWAPLGATWTWPRSAARRTGRTRPRTTRRRRPTGGGTTTTPTAHERGAPNREMLFDAKRDPGFRVIALGTGKVCSHQHSRTSESTRSSVTCRCSTNRRSKATLVTAWGLQSMSGSDTAVRCPVTTPPSTTELDAVVAVEVDYESPTGHYPCCSGAVRVVGALSQSG